jgi:hypothetical protein
MILDLDHGILHVGWNAVVIGIFNLRVRIGVDAQKDDHNGILFDLFSVLRRR